MKRIADHERSLQLIARQMTNGVLSERDLLFQYSIGEYHQELSLFIQEVETKNKELEKIYKK